MTDRELLESAARAAGYELLWRGSDERDELDVIDGHVPYRKEGRSLYIWNPRDRSADAFNLLCKLSMRIIEDHGGAYRAVQFTMNSGTDDESEHEEEIDWPHTPAATCLAITRAAAAIGKKVK